MSSETKEARRPRLHAMAYRLLGSADAADDAVRETERRLAAAEAAARRPETVVSARDAGATAVLAGICLGALREREARRPDPWDPWAPARPGWREERERPDPGDLRDLDDLLADPDEPALLHALDGLTPAERVVLVLHDLFAVPYEEIAPVLDHTAAVTRQVAVRARARLRGAQEMPEPDPARQREAVLALHTALRTGDPYAVRMLLDPDAVLRADAAALREGVRPAHGAPAVGLALAADPAMSAHPALVDGVAGLVGPGTPPRGVLGFTVLEGRVTAIDVLADPGHVARLEIRPLAPLPAGASAAGAPSASPSPSPSTAPSTAPS